MPETGNRQSSHEVDRALAQAADLGRLQESSRNSEIDRSNIWKNIAALRDIAAQNSLILSKMEDLTKGQAALTSGQNTLAVALSDHEAKINERLTALERRDERSKGAMGALLAIASGVGGGIAIFLQWALVHFWPTGTGSGSSH